MVSVRRLNLDNVFCRSGCRGNGREKEIVLECSVFDQKVMIRHMLHAYYSF